MATIFCIDDDHDTLEVRKNVLRSSGYTVLASQSGPLALEMLSSGTHVDLVLLDYLMPAMNGDQVAESLKAKFPDLPVIAVSAVRLPERMLELVDAYVQKGQEVEVLLSAIEKVLSPPSAKSEASFGGKTVLCADDEINELTARKMVLESAGFKVLTARNGKDASGALSFHPSGRCRARLLYAGDDGALGGSRNEKSASRRSAGHAFRIRFAAWRNNWLGRYVGAKTRCGSASPRA